MCIWSSAAMCSPRISASRSASCWASGAVMQNTRTPRCSEPTAPSGSSRPLTAISYPPLGGGRAGDERERVPLLAGQSGAQHARAHRRASERRVDDGFAALELGELVGADSELAYAPPRSAAGVRRSVRGRLVGGLPDRGGAGELREPVAGLGRV